MSHRRLGISGGRSARARCGNQPLGAPRTGIADHRVQHRGHLSGCQVGRIRRALVLLPLSVLAPICASLALVTALLAIVGFGSVPVRSPPIAPTLVAAAPEAIFADVTAPAAIVAACDPDPGPAFTSPVSWVMPLLT